MTLKHEGTHGAQTHAGGDISRITVGRTIQLMKDCAGGKHMTWSGQPARRDTGNRIVRVVS